MHQNDAGEKLVQITACTASRSRYAILACSDSAANCGLLDWLWGSCLHFQQISAVTSTLLVTIATVPSIVTAGRREMADRGRGKGPKPPTRTCFSAHLTVTLSVACCRMYAMAYT